MPISARVSSVSQNVSFGPLRFIGTGDPVRPRRPDRFAGVRGIQFSGKVGFAEFTIPFSSDRWYRGIFSGDQILITS